MNELDLEVIILLWSNGELLKKPEKRCLLPVPEVAITVVPHLQNNTKHTNQMMDSEGAN